MNVTLETKFSGGKIEHCEDMQGAAFCLKNFSTDKYHIFLMAAHCMKKRDSYSGKRVIYDDLFFKNSLNTDPEINKLTIMISSNNVTSSDNKTATFPIIPNYIVEYPDSGYDLAAVFVPKNHIYDSSIPKYNIGIYNAQCDKSYVDLRGILNFKIDKNKGISYYMKLFPRIPISKENYIKNFIVLDNVEVPFGWSGSPVLLTGNQETIGFIRAAEDFEKRLPISETDSTWSRMQLFPSDIFDWLNKIISTKMVIFDEIMDVDFCDEYDQKFGTANITIKLDYTTSCMYKRAIYLGDPKKIEIFLGKNSTGKFAYKIIDNMNYY